MVQTHSIIFTTLLANSADDKLMIFFLLSPESRIWHFKFQFLLSEEIRKILQNFVCWKFYQGTLVQNLIKLLANVMLKFQNLMKLLANVTLKFLSWNMSYSHFCSKNINVLENTLAITVNGYVINKLVKLKMLWTTGPRVLGIKE